MYMYTPSAVSYKPSRFPEITVHIGIISPVAIYKWLMVIGTAYVVKFFILTTEHTGTLTDGLTLLLKPQVFLLEVEIEAANHSALTICMPY